MTDLRFKLGNQSWQLICCKQIRWVVKTREMQFLIKTRFTRELCDPEQCHGRKVIQDQRWVCGYLAESLRCPRNFTQSLKITTEEILGWESGKGRSVLAPDLPQSVMWLLAIYCTPPSGPQQPRQWMWCVRVGEKRWSLMFPPALSYCSLINWITVKDQTIRQASLFRPEMLKAVFSGVSGFLAVSTAHVETHLATACGLS